MSDMDPREFEIDHLLQRSMAAPVPDLSQDFEQRLADEIQRRSQPIGPRGRIVLIGYGMISLGVSVWVMRDQGLGLPEAAAVIGIMLALMGAISLALRSRALSDYPSVHPAGNKNHHRSRD